MKEVKDPEIRLFGRKIVLPERGGGGEPSAESCGSGGGGGIECQRDLESSGGVEEGEGDEKRIHWEEVQVSELCNSEEPNSGGVEESGNPTKSDSGENPKCSSTDEGGISENQTKAENGQQKKVLKKPDKVLPCPRCNSMDTKFCYYNNYNVNQPRHFCKSCQRYWTAGGTMRNVPVGAGRRKNKTATSLSRHITISDAFLDAPNGLHYPAFKPNGTHVLSFANASSLCESVASGLILPDKRMSNGIRNRHPDVDHDHGDDCSVASSVITTNSSADIGAQQSGNAFPSPVSCLPGVPWPVPWNSALAIYPIPFCPAPYWNAPWPSMLSPAASQNPNSPLGKHSRNGELLKRTSSASKAEDTKPKNIGNSIVIPKTLRIDDPQEAAKSSIWETLGIKYDSMSREGLFKALHPKGDQKKPTLSPTSPALHANPAALSRSISFQEQA